MNKRKLKHSVGFILGWVVMPLVAGAIVAATGLRGLDIFAVSIPCGMVGAAIIICTDETFSQG